MVKLLENTKPNVDKFSQMVVLGVTYTEKAESEKAIIEACKKMTNPDPIIIGEYRGFSMELLLLTNLYLNCIIFNINII